ncbi:hypothetical protein HJG60_011522 [Phyllostomus discolor]|uniref:Uncharacterized protein n=1 Tax=Phyllostomus discolor TaxID=89673 RepID=A0A834DXE7_9CHIR|nr:hypothetical protein HJG60_011522 [Phyllostomus discolor]
MTASHISQKHTNRYKQLHTNSDSQTPKSPTTREPNTTQDTTTHPAVSRTTKHNCTRPYQTTKQSPLKASTHQRTGQPESQIAHHASHTHHNHSIPDRRGSPSPRLGGVAPPSSGQAGPALSTWSDLRGLPSLSSPPPRLWASTVFHTAADTISIRRSALGRSACGGAKTGRQADRRPWSAESSRVRSGRDGFGQCWAHKRCRN